MSKRFKFIQTTDGDFFLKKGHLCLCESEGNMRLTGIVQGIEILVLCGWTLFAKLNAVLLSVEYWGLKQGILSLYFFGHS